MKSVRYLVLVIFLFAVQASVAQNIDIDILKGINPQNPNSDVWKAASGSVDWVKGAVSFGTLGYGLITKDKGMQQNGCELLLSSGISIASATLLKIAFDRTRPAVKYPGEVFVNSTTTGKSFPSGHTSGAFALATTLTLQYKKWYVALPAYLWAGSVGYSRMYLGKHYPSDVLAGAAVGAGSSWLSHIITQKFFTNKK